jgi:site-specific DNA-methyltransferase (adenine-specific)
MGSDGSAARFFYCAKSSRGERGDGNNHTTVKPLALMEYLCKLVSMPEYNLILDPFCGSGTTLIACTRLGIPSVGIDSDEKSCEIAANRCAKAAVERVQRGEY